MIVSAALGIQGYPLDIGDVGIFFDCDGCALSVQTDAVHVLVCSIRIVGTIHLRKGQLLHRDGRIICRRYGLCIKRRLNRGDFYRCLNINLGILLRSDGIHLFGCCCFAAQHKLARSLRILDRQLGAICGRCAGAGIYGCNIAVSGSHTERQVMPRKIDRKIGDGAAVVICQCGVFTIEAGTCLCLRQITPLILRQRIRSPRCICRRNGGVVSNSRGGVATLAVALKGDVLACGGGG